MLGFQIPVYNSKLQALRTGREADREVLLRDLEDFEGAGVGRSDTLRALGLSELPGFFPAQGHKRFLGALRSGFLARAADGRPPL